MSKPCDAVPAQLWISDSLVIHSPGNQLGHGKLDWTPVLVDRCEAMRENGDSWGDIAGMLFEQTGVRLSPSSVRDYMLRQAIL